MTTDDEFLAKLRATSHEINAGFNYGKGFLDGAVHGADTERARIRAGVLAYYQVAPKAAEPILAIIDRVEAPDA